jgi:hypothetical protein
MKVKIKTWEAMEAQYGLDGPDAINCDCSFLDSMEEDLPSDRVITVTPDQGNYAWQIDAHSDHDTWEISDQMIEEVIDPETTYC